LRVKPSEKGAMNSSTEIKHYYDQLLNVGTCRCLIGMKAEIKEVKLTAFDRFSAYMEFFSEGITTKFTKSDLKKLNPSKQLNIKVHINGSELENNNNENFLNPNNNQFFRGDNLGKNHSDCHDTSRFINTIIGYNSFSEKLITEREHYALIELDKFLDSKKVDILQGNYIPTISRVNFDYSDSSLIKYYNIKSHIRRWLAKNTPCTSITSLKSYFGKGKPNKVYKPQLGYDILQFMEDIRNELQMYPIILCKIFPDRTKRYSYKDLSLYWQEEGN
jgi:hypothetical protein